jgi:hypothetical protein
MSQSSRGILAAFAVALTFGAVQLAAGRDLAGALQNPQGTPEQGTPETAINRAAKADRGAVVAGSTAETKTISLRLDALSDMSVVVRIPVARETREEARNIPAPRPPMTKSSDRKMAVACEPVVSVLTEVAKLLQPGRCVT